MGQREGERGAERERTEREIETGPGEGSEREGERE